MLAGLYDESVFMELHSSQSARVSNASSGAIPLSQITRLVGRYTVEVMLPLILSLSQKQMVSGRFARPVWFGLSPVNRLLQRLVGGQVFGQAVKCTLGCPLADS